jgi:hypothetical protein
MSEGSSGGLRDDVVAVSLTVNDQVRRIVVEPRDPQPYQEAIRTAIGGGLGLSVMVVDRRGRFDWRPPRRRRPSQRHHFAAGDHHQSAL